MATGSASGAGLPLLRERLRGDGTEVPDTGGVRRRLDIAAAAQKLSPEPQVFGHRQRGFQRVLMAEVMRLLADRGGRGGRGGSFRRRKFCKFCADTILQIDYKDPEMLGHYVTERSKSGPARVTGTGARHQRAMTTAIKRARILALLPFTTQHRD